MCGRAFEPRFTFIWPTAKIAVMGPKQIAGVMSIVRPPGRRAKGRPFDEEADAKIAPRSRRQEASRSRSRPARISDDGIIDPRDTRTVLGICLVGRAQHAGRGRRGYGVFRL